MKTILNIEGMSCEHCVKHVKEALEEMAGVHKALVNLEQKTATVEHDESVAIADMRAAIEEVGYEVV